MTTFVNNIKNQVTLGHNIPMGQIFTGKAAECSEMNVFFKTENGIYTLDARERPGTDFGGCWGAGTTFIDYHPVSKITFE